MLQNKIYQNFLQKYLKIFYYIICIIINCFNSKSCKFLDLIVDNGYPVIIYFKYCFLNLFGIAPKFIPLSLLLALTIFIVKHLQDSEFVILWTSGVKNLFNKFTIFYFYNNFINLFYLYHCSFSNSPKQIETAFGK